MDGKRRPVRKQREDVCSDVLFLEDMINHLSDLRLTSPEAENVITQLHHLVRRKLRRYKALCELPDSKGKTSKVDSREDKTSGTCVEDAVETLACRMATFTQIVHSRIGPDYRQHRRHQMRSSLRQRETSCQAVKYRRTATSKSAVKVLCKRELNIASKSASLPVIAEEVRNSPDGDSCHGILSDASASKPPTDNVYQVPAESTVTKPAGKAASHSLTNTHSIPRKQCVAKGGYSKSGQTISRVIVDKNVRIDSSRTLTTNKNMRNKPQSKSKPNPDNDTILTNKLPGILDRPLDGGSMCYDPVSEVLPTKRQILAGNSRCPEQCHRKAGIAVISTGRLPTQASTGLPSRAKKGNSAHVRFELGTETR